MGKVQPKTDPLPLMWSLMARCGGGRGMYGTVAEQTYTFSEFSYLESRVLFSVGSLDSVQLGGLLEGGGCNLKVADLIPERVGVSQRT